MTPTDRLKDLKTIKQAAKEVHIARGRAKEIAISHGIAIRWGGTDKNPRLKVSVDELRRAILAERHRPAVKEKPKLPRRPPANPERHPLVRC